MLNVASLLESSPLPIPHSSNFRATLAGRLATYRHAVDQLDPRCGAIERAARKNRHVLQSVETSILQAIDAEANGDHATATGEITSAIDTLRPWLSRLVSRRVGVAHARVMYRLRAYDITPPTQLGQIFHLDAGRRHLAADARYSMRGAPSLYLARSLFTAWRELDSPNSFVVSAFRLSDEGEMKVLDFGYSPELASAIARDWRVRIANALRLQPVGEFLVAYCLSWPIIAACSAERDRNVQVSVHPEWFVPQLLLEWVASTDVFIGVRYFSTRGIEATEGLFVQNLVFPAKDIGTRGYSPSLCDVFRLTKPLVFKDAAALGVGMGPPSQNRTEFRDLDGTIRSYFQTDYSAAEACLEGQVFHTLDPEDVP